MKQKLKLILKILGGILIFLLVLIEGVDQFLSTDRGILWFYKNISQEKSIKRTQSGMRYLEIGKSDNPAILLIHGAPGSIADWQRLSQDHQLLQAYKLLIPDRPGYGGTTPNEAETSVITQAELLLEVIENEKIPVKILGHSYGAPIAMVMDTIAPEKISHIIGASGQYNPENEIIFPISYFIDYKIFGFILPRLIWRSNQEKLAHPLALEEIIPLYSKITSPVTLVHGESDTLVHFENSPWLQEKLQGESTLVALPGVNHALQMSLAPVLAELLLKE